MHRTVLAAANRAAAAGPALELALALARPFGARVVLAGVVERHGAEPPEGDPRLNALLGRLGTLAETAPADVPVAVDRTTATSIVRGLHRLAETHDAQLLVLGPDDHGALRRALFGDRAANTAFTAPCGVAVATAAASRAAPRSIGVAWDRTAEAGEALEWAVQLAERTGATIEIVHVAGARPGAAVPAIEAELERLRAAVGRRASATTTTATGPTAALLEHVSGRIDLLVLGSRARGPLRRTLLGSVSQAVLHTARCPVVIMPRGVHAPADTAAV